jgi:hypothetical protein
MDISNEEGRKYPKTVSSEYRYSKFIIYSVELLLLYTDCKSPTDKEERKNPLKLWALGSGGCIAKTLQLVTTPSTGQRIHPHLNIFAAAHQQKRLPTYFFVDVKVKLLLFAF